MSGHFVEGGGVHVLLLQACGYLVNYFLGFLRGMQLMKLSLEVVNCGP